MALDISSQANLDHHGRAIARRCRRDVRRGTAGKRVPDVNLPPLFQVSQGARKTGEPTPAGVRQPSCTCHRWRHVDGNHAPSLAATTATYKLIFSRELVRRRCAAKRQNTRRASATAIQRYCTVLVLCLR
jgi:hypothetical protein